MEQRKHREVVAKGVETTDDTTLSVVENITRRLGKFKILSEADVQVIASMFRHSLTRTGVITPAELHAHLDDSITRYLMEQDPHGDEWMDQEAYPPESVDPDGYPGWHRCTWL